MAYSTSYDSSIAALLEDVRRAADLEGLAVVDLSEPKGGHIVLSSAGFGGIDTVAAGCGLLSAMMSGPSLIPSHTMTPDKRPIIGLPWVLPPSAPGGLLLWRSQRARPWAQSDHGLVASIAVLLQAFISSEAGQIGIDRQTGLPNRRWFIDEVDRHIERLDRDGEVGTLLLVDIDDLRRFNASRGRATGDRLLVQLASHLRMMIRPGDLLARVGGDEFAVWQNGMDQLTAAERADALCSQPIFKDLPPGEAVTVSVGIASRSSASIEDVRSLLERALEAVKEVKGKAGWRVSPGRIMRRAPDRRK